MAPGPVPEVPLQPASAGLPASEVSLTVLPDLVVKATGAKVD